jgi:hypothetical protein
MSPNTNRIRWEPLPAGVDVAEAVVERVDRAGGVRALLHRVGVPVVEGAESAREAALALLGVAAEVEHALMVQYIYAALSLSADPAPDGVAYREQVLRVAVQEMGHLATVQNLLLLLGGRDAVHFQRDTLRTHSDKNPIPFVLEPVGEVSLATYVAAEMPAVVPPELAERVAELVELAEHTTGVDVHRVGVIYELLQWMFDPDHPAVIDFTDLVPLPGRATLDDDDLQDLAVVRRHEARRAEWMIFDDDIVLPRAHTRQEARAALAAVAAQGEGLQDLQESHFGEFLKLEEAFRRGEVVVRPMPTSPTLDTGCPTGTPLVHPYARLWAQVFDLHYALLVVTLAQTFGTPRADDEPVDAPDPDSRRSTLAGIALFGMRQVLGALGDLVAELPLRADGSGTAGPPFTLDPAVLAANDDAALTAQQLRLLDLLATRYTAVEAAPDFADHPDHANTLANLRRFDAERLGVIAPSSRTPGGPQ